MATYRIDTPDGASYQVEADSDEKAQSAINDLLGSMAPQQAQQPQGPQWSDIPDNILEGIKEAPETLKGILTPFPIKAMNAIEQGGMQMALHPDHPIDALITATSPTLPGALAGMARDYGAGQALQGDIPGALQQLKNTVIQKPISTAVNVAALVAPFLASNAKNIVSNAGEAMQSKGAELANELGEVSGNTVKKINPEVLGEEANQDIRSIGGKPNVADIREQVGKKLVKDKVVGGFGQQVGDRLQQAGTLANKYGNDVGSTISAIKDTGIESQVEAKIVLEPLLNKWVKIAETDPSLAKPYANLHNRLENIANRNGGTLSFEDIDNELHAPGLKEAFKRNPDSPAFQAASAKYAVLADARDQIVNDIANRTNQPELADNLRKANQGYSFYTRVAKGLEDAGAGGDIPEKLGRHIVHGVMSNEPVRIAKFIGIRKLLNSLEPVAAEKFVNLGEKATKGAATVGNAMATGPALTALINQLKAKYDERRKF